MTAHSIFDDGSCDVQVVTVGGLVNDLGQMSKGDSATFLDPNDPNAETVTVAVDANGVVSLSRDSDFGLDSVPDGYLIKVFPAANYAAATVWMEEFFVEAPAGLLTQAACNFANDVAISPTTGTVLTVAQDGTCTPDPSPMVQGMPSSTFFELSAEVSIG